MAHGNCGSSDRSFQTRPLKALGLGSCAVADLLQNRRIREAFDRDIMRVGDVWTTTPLRTALDLGCHLRRRDAYAALNEFARLHGITPEQLSPSCRASAVAGESASCGR